MSLSCCSSHSCISMLLLAEPTMGAILWGIVSAVGTVLSFISLIWIDIKEVDDKIEELKKEIHILNLAFVKHDTAYIGHKLKRLHHESKVTEYEGKGKAKRNTQNRGK